jgi:hypothetical protein
MPPVVTGRRFLEQRSRPVDPDLVNGHMGGSFLQRASSLAAIGEVEEVAGARTCPGT